MSFEVLKDQSLLPWNSLRVESRCELLVQIAAPEQFTQIPALVKSLGHPPLLFLGGGSNVILPDFIPGLVLLIRARGLKFADEGNEVFVTAQAGENWSDFVDATVDRGLYGIENLALIPGTVGAAPVQNIGAYGTELQDSFHSLWALNLQSGAEQEFDREACQFAYRKSWFQSEEGQKYLIREVTFRLSKTPVAAGLHQEVEAALRKMPQAQRTAKATTEIVKEIRRRKLPDPATHPNVGSFFVNPIISASEYLKLKEAYPEVPSYAAPKGRKIPAAWLIEQCGWKGRRQGKVATSNQHALVIINEDQATGAEILEFAALIQAAVQAKFKIRIQIEPRQIAINL